MLFRVFFLVSLLCSAAAAFASVILQDDAGHTLTLAQPAKRIVALTPHVAELVFAAGAGDRLAAVSVFSDYPPAATRLPIIGDANRIDLEAIVRLKPDLVIGWASGTSPLVIRQLPQLDIPVWLTEAHQVGDIARQLRQIGQLAGSEKAAKQAAEQFEQQWQALRTRYSRRPPVSVFYQIWPSPPMTVNGTHFISDVMRACGGRNIFADLPVLTPTVSVEAVVQRNPQVIVASGAYTGDPAQWKAWQGLPIAAVQRHRLYELPPDLIQRPTPRILQGAALMCEDLEKARH